MWGINGTARVLIEYTTSFMGHRERGVSRAVETLSGREMLSAAAFAKFIGVSRESCLGETHRKRMRWRRSLRTKD